MGILFCVCVWYFIVRGTDTGTRTNKRLTTRVALAWSSSSSAVCPTRKWDVLMKSLRIHSSPSGNATSVRDGKKGSGWKGGHGSKITLINELGILTARTKIKSSINYTPFSLWCLPVNDFPCKASQNATQNVSVAFRTNGITFAQNTRMSDRHSTTTAAITAPVCQTAVVPQSVESTPVKLDTLFEIWVLIATLSVSVECYCFETLVICYSILAFSVAHKMLRLNIFTMQNCWAKSFTRQKERLLKKVWSIFCNHSALYLLVFVEAYFDLLWPFTIQDPHIFWLPRGSWLTSATLVTAEQLQPITAQSSWAVTNQSPANSQINSTPAIHCRRPPQWAGLGNARVMVGCGTFPIVTVIASNQTSTSFYRSSSKHAWLALSDL